MCRWESIHASPKKKNRKKNLWCTWNRDRFDGGSIMVSGRIIGNQKIMGNQKTDKVIIQGSTLYHFSNNTMILKICVFILWLIINKTVTVWGFCTWVKFNAASQLFIDYCTCSSYLHYSSHLVVPAHHLLLCHYWNENWYEACVY
jgi:hypothetical protein